MDFEQGGVFGNEILKVKGSAWSVFGLDCRLGALVWGKFGGFYFGFVLGQVGFYLEEALRWAVGFT